MGKADQHAYMNSPFSTYEDYLESLQIPADRTKALGSVTCKIDGETGGTKIDVTGPTEKQPTKSEPIPLLKDASKGKPYPVQSLGPLREAVEAAQDKTQAPIAIAAQSALATASLAVQGHANIETLNGGTVPISLFCLTIAVSGERKSTCDRLFTTGITDVEQQRSAEYDIARANTGVNDSKPLTPELITSDTTVEGILRNFEEGSPTYGLFSDEGGNFFGGYAMTQDNRLKTIATISKLWDADKITRSRAGTGTKTFWGRRFCVNLMAQPVALDPILSDKTLNGQGFLPRFLISKPESTIGKRLRRDCNPKSDIALRAFRNHLRAVLQRPLPTKSHSQQELDPRTLVLSTKANDLLWDFYEDVELGQAKSGRYENLTGFASKAPEQAARIAGVLTLWEDVDAKEVSEQTMMNAVTLASYYLDEARRLVIGETVSGETKDAEALREWIFDFELWSERYVSPTNISQFGPNRFREANTARRLLVILEEHGWVRKVEGGAEIKGQHRREAWEIHGR